MIYKIFSTGNNFSTELEQATAQYRHKIFIEKLGWPLPNDAGVERDQFDRPDTIYVVVSDEQNQLCGCARLLPTTQPYLLGEVFPYLLNGVAAPSAAHIWEISRFAVTNADQHSAIPLQPCEMTRKLLAAVVERAAQEGATRLITVSPLAIERLLQRLGVSHQRAAAPQSHDNRQIFACWIEIDAITRDALGITALAIDHELD